MSSIRIHCCYIINSTDFKEKHILEHDRLFCCAIISSGKRKKICPFLLLENSRPLFPPQEPQTSYQPAQELTLSAISCVTTSNLPWFMDLTFQVPMQYCSLQHWTLFPPPSYPQLGIVFTLSWSLHSFWSSSSSLLQAHLLTWEFIF